MRMVRIIGNIRVIMVIWQQQKMMRMDAIK